MERGSYRRWRGSRLFGQWVRPHGHPESFSPGKIDEDGPELFPPDHLRGNRSRAAPAKGRAGLGGERRREPLSAHEREDELSVVDRLVGQAGILIDARGADAVEPLGSVERKGLGTRLDDVAPEPAGRGAHDVQLSSLKLAPVCRVCRRAPARNGTSNA